MKKSRSVPLPGYSAVYNYESSFGRQKIMVKYADDVAAIDLLLANGHNRASGFVANQPCNLFTEPGKRKYTAFLP